MGSSFPAAIGRSMDMSRTVARITRVSPSARTHRARFEELYELHFRAVAAYVLRRRPDPVAVADVAAETFTVVWRRIDIVPPGDEARPWIFGVARRVLANERRSAMRRSRLAKRVESLASALQRSVESSTIQAEAVQQVLDRLSSGDAELLRLAYWEQLTPSEISVVLDIRGGTVRSRLTRARMKFQEQYLSEFGDVPVVPAHAQSVAELKEDRKHE